MSERELRAYYWGNLVELRRDYADDIAAAVVECITAPSCAVSG